MLLDDLPSKRDRTSSGMGIDTVTIHIWWEVLVAWLVRLKSPFISH